MGPKVIQIMIQARDMASGVFAKLSTAAAGVAAQLSTAATGVATRLGPVVSGLATRLGSVVEGVGTRLGKVVIELAPVAADVFASMSKSAAGVTADVGKAAAGVTANLGKAAAGVGTRLGSVVTGAVSAVAGFFSEDAFGGVVKGAANLEEAMSKVQAATGASSEEMARFKAAAQEASAGSSFSSVEALGALQNLAKAGLSATDAIGALPAAVSLAGAGSIDLAASSELLTKVIGGMGGQFSDAAHYADVLALAAQATDTNVVGLGQALGEAAPVAQKMGLKLEPTVAMLGKLADAGIDAGRSGTALKGILTQFSDPASNFRNELAQAGITTTDFETALHQLADAGPAGSKAIQSVGTEAGPALRELIGQGTGALDELTGRLQNSEGSAAAVAATMRNNLNGALGSLGSAWELVKDTLGTPVLPVLKQGVEQVTAVLRGAVADGSVTRFGESIATAFTQAIQFVREFLSNFSFSEVVARLQSFADEANAKLTLVAGYATAAANLFKFAWGVMAAGSSAVLAAIYGVGSVFAEIVSGIQSGFAKLDGLFSKFTFGKRSKEFAESAAEMKLASEASGAAAQALRDKATKALGDVADSAQGARDGFAGLMNGASETVPATTAATQATAALTTEINSSAAAAAAAGVAYQKKMNDEQLTKQAAEEHRAAIAALRAEYETAVANGDWQAAATAQVKLTEALRQNKTEAGVTGEALKKAFSDLGVTSSAALTDQATKTKAAYELIKSSGTSTAADLSAGFRKAAADAIAANNGVAPSWVAAEASARGYRVEVDASGKAHLELANKAGSGLTAVASGWQMSKEALEAQQEAMDKLLMKYTLSADYTERQIKLLEREAAAAEKAAEAYRKKWNVDKEGYSLNTAGERVLAGESEQDVSNDVARLYGEQNRDNKDARRARQLRALARLRSKGNGFVTQRDLSADERRELDELEYKLLNAAQEKPEATVSKTGTATPQASGKDGKDGKDSQSGSTRPRERGISAGLGTTVVFNLQSGAKSVKTTPDGATALKSVLEELTNGKGTSR